MSAETLQFKAEMKQMMDIIVNSLYSNADIFLRELISNAADAIDKARFESITKPEILEGDADWKVKLIPDQAAGTLTIRDNGIGMDRARVIEDLGTVARSGTREFIQKLREADAAERPELIGQFGLGFYSTYMVADKVTVISRMAGDKAAGVKWESDGKGEYSVEAAEKDTRGTDIIVHLKEDKLDYLDEWRLRSLVRSFSDFIEHPVVMDVEKTEKGEDDKEIKTIEEETLNSRKALWQRAKSEIKDEEYTEFYKHLTRDFEAPAKTIHFMAEGAIEFRALLYIPRRRPFDFLNPDHKNGLNLYIKRVFIMDNCEELLPPYLRFVQGVVDASDLPLNVSREILQQNPMTEKIKKNLVGKILSALEEMQKEEKDVYTDVQKAFGTVLKEGVYTDFSNRERLADLLQYESTQKEKGEAITLNEYLEAMPANQEAIYYIVGESRDILERSPHLESFTDKGYNVLLMTEPIDEWVTQGLMEYKGKKLVAVDRGDVAADEEEKKERDEKSESFKGLTAFMGELIDEVKEVRLSTRLKDSAACLVLEEGRMGAYVENIMKRLNQDEFGESPRILELNPEHAAIKALKKLHDKDAQSTQLKDYASLIYDQAVLAEGSKIKDPQAFAKRINDLLVRDAALS